MCWETYAGADCGLRCEATGRDGEFCCIGELRGLKSTAEEYKNFVYSIEVIQQCEMRAHLLIWVRRLPVETFVLDVMRMVLFSNLVPGPLPDPPLPEDGTGPPLAPDMGATFDAGIKLGLFVISLLQEDGKELYLVLDKWNTPARRTYSPCLLYLYIMV